MLHNFESWRKAKQKRFEPYEFEMHYHKCADSCYKFVAALLQSLVSNFVSSQHRPQVVQLSVEHAQILLDFLEQMQFAYIHPRSTSARYLMVRECAFSSLLTPNVKTPKL